MSTEAVLILIFIAATLLGYKLIKNVPSLLHTPLMSGMNALSGITVLGMITATAGAVALGSRVLGLLGIVLAVINVVSGFMVTDRMLKMFRGSGEKEKAQ